MCHRPLVLLSVHASSAWLLDLDLRPTNFNLSPPYLCTRRARGRPTSTFGRRCRTLTSRLLICPRAERVVSRPRPSDLSLSVHDLGRPTNFDLPLLICPRAERVVGEPNFDFSPLICPRAERMVASARNHHCTALVNRSWSRCANGGDPLASLHKGCPLSNVSHAPIRGVGIGMVFHFQTVHNCTVFDDDDDDDID